MKCVMPMITYGNDTLLITCFPRADQLSVDTSAKDLASEYIFLGFRHC